jgi:hypothetical protein
MHHTPGMYVGTSTEFLGRRPIPLEIRGRYAAVVLGPSGAGKSEVARRLVTLGVDGVPVLTWAPSDLDREASQRARRGRWSTASLAAPALLIDEPVWLGTRRGVFRQVCELVALRAAAEHRTVLIQREGDTSAEEVVKAMAPGSIVTIALRFPSAPRGRVRFARRLCDELGVPRSAAKDCERLDPWRYDAVRALVMERAGLLSAAPTPSAVQITP